MTTLESGSNRLSRIERKRNLADALAQQALQGPGAQNFRHPLQGWAMLAQALASGAINRNADKTQKAQDIARQRALVNALGDVTERVPTAVQTFEQIEGGPPPLEPQTIFQTQTRKPTSMDIVSRLPPDYAEPIAAEIASRRALVEAGLTDQQLKNQYGGGNLSTFGKDLMLMQNMGVPEPVIRGMVADKLGMENITGFMAGSETPSSALRHGGRIYEAAPITEDNPFGIGRDVTSQFIESNINIQPDDFSVFGKAKGEAQGVYIGYQQSVGILDSMIADIAQAGPQALSLTGTVSTGINTFFNQARALTNTALGRRGSVRGRESVWSDGKRVATINGKTVDESALLNPAYYDSYFNDVFDNPAMQAIASNAIERQRIKTQAIKLAYSMARADDPGGRLSERDVQAQLEAMGLEQGDPRVTMTALFELREIMDRNTGIALDVMSEGQFPWQPVPMSPNVERIRQAMGRGPVPTEVGGRIPAPPGVEVGSIHRDMDPPYDVLEVVEEDGQKYYVPTGRKWK